MSKAAPTNTAGMVHLMPVGNLRRWSPTPADTPARGACRYPARPPTASNGSVSGFTYIAILIAVAIIGAALATTGVVWHTHQQREREQQLLFVGGQFRQAIGRYYSVGAGVGAAGQYPTRLDDLLRDPRRVGIARYLRKIYHDPITGDRKWGLIKDARGEILGVHSLSQAHPIKQSNFPLMDKQFEGKDKYSEWTFIYSPKSKRPAASAVPPASANIAPNRP